MTVETASVSGDGETVRAGVFVGSGGAAVAAGATVGNEGEPTVGEAAVWGALAGSSPTCASAIDDPAEGASSEHANRTMTRQANRAVAIASTIKLNAGVG